MNKSTWTYPTYRYHIVKGFYIYEEVYFKNYYGTTPCTMLNLLDCSLVIFLQVIIPLLSVWFLRLAIFFSRIDCVF